MDEESLQPLLRENKQTGGIKWRALFWHIIVTLLVLAHLAAFAIYLHVKLSLYSVHHRELLKRPWLILLLICEFGYFLSSLFGAADFILPPRIRLVSPLPELQHFPTVDVFLPCCKEPTDVPEDSILAALALDYPKHRLRVLVLDDGADDKLKAFCEHLSAKAQVPAVLYFRREKVPGVPHNFKCGNMNFGLGRSDAEFVVMMDADMILHPSFLKVTLPYIVNNPEVAFTQIPQSFYNLPAGDPLNDACVFGYDRVLVHRDTFGVTSCVGTGAVFRRKCVDEIGGFQPMSITEDTMTAYVLFNHGYKSVYINRKLQAGLTPWTFEGYIKQRMRWCVGSFQQFSSSWMAMLGPRSKLSFILKIYYAWHTWYHYLFFVHIVMAILLLATLAFGLELAVGDSEDNRKVIISLSVFLILWRISWMALWVGLPQSVQSRNRDESHPWWMTPFFIKSVLQFLFFYSSTFKFTPTSNIDRLAANAISKQSPLTKQLSKLKRVRVHVVYILLVLGVIGYRLSFIVKHGGRNCEEDFFMTGISLFLLCTCAHMLVPICYILRSPDLQYVGRRKLLQYKEGVPQFSEGDHAPKWHWSVAPYEALSWVIILFWFTTLVVAITKKDLKEGCYLITF